MKNVGNSSRGRSQGVPKIFRAPIYKAHCAVIFAIPQLSCSSFDCCGHHGVPCGPWVVEWMCWCCLCVDSHRHLQQAVQLLQQATVLSLMMMLRQLQLPSTELSVQQMWLVALFTMHLTPQMYFYHHYLLFCQFLVVLCKYSKFQIESNSYFSIRLETSTIIRNFRILTVIDFLLI